MSAAPEAYEANALKFANVRDKSNIGARTVKTWAETLKKDASVIDIGCGAGYPISSVLDSLELKLWAIDSSPALLKLYSSRFPDIPVQCATIQDSDLFNKKFDAAIAIGLMFLLSEDDQISIISKIAGALNTDGLFLFTAPHEIASWADISTECDSLSLGYAKYQEVLNESGFKLLNTFTDSGNNNYFSAQRI